MELFYYVFQVDKLRIQAAEQAELVATQEQELNSKKEQLEGLKQEEQRLEQLKIDSTKKLENLTTNLQDTQLNISQVIGFQQKCNGFFLNLCVFFKAKALITQLQEQTRQMNDAITACDAAIESGDASIVPDTSLRINPDFRDPEYTKIGLVNGNGNNKQQTNFYGGFDDDPFKSQNANNPNSGFNDDPFKNGFSNDPFNNSAFTTKSNVKLA